MKQNLDKSCQLIDINAIAEQLDVSPRTVSRLVRDGVLPEPVTVGRSVRWHSNQVAESIRNLPKKES